MRALFLKEGRWFGGEFPEAPVFRIDTKVQPGKVCAIWNGEVKASYDTRSNDYAYANADNFIELLLKTYRNKVEKAKSEALEVINPELAFMFQTKPGRGDWTDPIKDGVLYPWDGEVEIEYQCVSSAIHQPVGFTEWIKIKEPGGKNYEYFKNQGIEVRKVLRLLPKSPVIPEGSKLCPACDSLKSVTQSLRNYYHDY